jgi:hypothetical protein
MGDRGNFAVVLKGDLKLAAEALQRMGRWWGLSVSSRIEPPFYYRRLSLGPLPRTMHTK